MRVPAHGRMCRAPAGVAEVEVSLLRASSPDARAGGRISLGASLCSERVNWAPPFRLKLTIQAENELMLIFSLQVNALYLHMWEGYLFSIYLA